jgi:hypothetical protein
MKNTDKSNYYTEYSINRVTSKEIYFLRDSLKTIGDSVCVDINSDGKIKVHIHTEHPGKAIEAGLLFGSLVDIRIKNLEVRNEN